MTPLKTLPDGREICRPNAAGWCEYKHRTELLWNRQYRCCAICLAHLTLERAQMDHQNGRGLSGGYRDDRIEIEGAWNNAALCWKCNALKGSKRYRWVGGYYLYVIYETVAAASAAGVLGPQCDAPWLPDC